MGWQKENFYNSDLSSSYVDKNFHPVEKNLNEIAEILFFVLRPAKSLPLAKEASIHQSLRQQAAKSDPILATVE